MSQSTPPNPNAHGPDKSNQPVPGTQPVHPNQPVPASNQPVPAPEKPKTDEHPVTVDLTGKPIVPVSDTVAKGQTPISAPAPVVKPAAGGSGMTHKVNQAHPNQGEMSNAEVVRVATADATGNPSGNVGVQIAGQPETLLQRYQRERNEKLKALGIDDPDNPNTPAKVKSDKPDPSANMPKHLWKVWHPNSPERLVEAPDKMSARDVYYKQVGIVNSIHDPVIVDAFADLEHLAEQIEMNKRAKEEQQKNEENARKTKPK